MSEWKANSRHFDAPSANSNNKEHCHLLVQIDESTGLSQTESTMSSFNDLHTSNLNNLHDEVLQSSSLTELSVFSKKCVQAIPTYNSKTGKSDLLKEMDDNDKERMLDDLLQSTPKSYFEALDNKFFFFRAGVDKEKREILVFFGKWFKPTEHDPDTLFAYLVTILNSVVDSPNGYIVIYFNSRTTSQNTPSYWWMKNVVHQKLPYKYKKRLKAFYIVHPTFWTKATCWWFTTFMAPAIKRKIHNMGSLVELRQLVEDVSQLEIPMYVTEQDISWNGFKMFSNI